MGNRMAAYGFGVGTRRRRAILAGAVVAAIAGGGMSVAMAEAPAAKAGGKAGAVPALYSPDNDPIWAEPYIDVDEWRDAPVRHRYVHGGFKGTETRFSFYFPPKEQYQGRFFHYITPFPLPENTTQAAPAGGDNPIAFAIASGAYFIETNMGGTMDLGKVHAEGPKPDPAIGGYSANAAAAAYSRKVAVQMYGGKRPYGYPYGGSGGGFRTIGLAENTTGVWDGFVPFVIGSSQAIPNMFTVRIRAMRILGDKLDQVVDAASPGGSGDIYAGLTPVQVDALREVTRMGFPTEAWYLWRSMGIHGLSALYPGILAADPTYFTDFWTKPGYLGHDHPDQFEGARLQFTSNVANMLTGAEAVQAGLNIDASSEHQRGGVDEAFKQSAEGRRIAAFKLTSTPPTVPFLGGDLVVLSGPAQGKRLPVARYVGDVAVLGTANQDVAKQIQPGDQVRLDNSNFLALETYHRHQTPPVTEGFDVWNQFRNPDGTPKYPQRPMLLGPNFIPTVGRKQTGEIQGKMIVLESLWDREAMPWSADWYRKRVQKHLGARTDQNFRLWYTDHAVHGDVNPATSGEDPTRVVSYLPVLQQTLRDVAAWVEKGTPPPPSTQYRIADGQVIVPTTAAERKGIQPVITLTANGGERAEVAVGQPVTFTGTIEVPPGAGYVVGAEWDFAGKGDYPHDATVPAKARRVTVSATHRFDQPGTYFPALRGFSHRQGDMQTPFARIQNLDRVRVVVK